MHGLRMREDVLGQVQQEVDMQQVREGDNAPLRHSDARQQTPVDVLVYGHSSADGYQEDVFGKGDTAPARTQALSAYMGDGAQDTQRHGGTRLAVCAEGHLRT